MSDAVAIGTCLTSFLSRHLKNSLTLGLGRNTLMPVAGERLVGAHETRCRVDPDHALIAGVLSSFDERREFRECLAPASLIVGRRHAGR